MLLCEMTNPAFAYSIKRFAQVAVVGLALAGLAACGGGGGGDPEPDPEPMCPAGQERGEDGECRTPPPPPCPQGQVRVDGQCMAPTPPECPAGQERGEDGECRTPPPPPCPQGQVRVDGQCMAPTPPECPAGQERGEDGECRTPPPPPCPQGQVRVDGQCMAEMLNEYGSLAFAMNPWGDARTIVWTSQTAARDAAVEACEDACGSSSCGCQEVLWFRNACGSLARSSDTHRAGVGWGKTESAAQEDAVDACGQECTVSTTFCAQAGSATPDGLASPIPPRPCPAGQERRDDGQCPPPPCPPGQEREGDDGQCMAEPELGGGALNDVNVTLPASCPRQIDLSVA